MGLRRYNESVTFSRQAGRTCMVAAWLMTVATAGCAARGAASGPAPRPFPGAPNPPVTRDAPAASDRPDSSGIPPELISTALALRGTQYRNGGSEPSRGFDCSGFVQWVYAQHGTALPRETREQYALGKKIGEDDVQPGDLVFFETVSKGPSHVGIAIGGGEFVHAPSSRGVVRVESYAKSEYWADRWIGARRIASPATARLLPDMPASSSCPPNARCRQGQ
jgi:cell wall-associated NlpC family hydrolase